MSMDSITQLILQYRYWILIPLSFLEGPLVAFMAGTMAAVGYFNIYALAVLFFVRDVGMDAVYYSIGYFGGSTRLASRMLAKLGVTVDHMEKVRSLWIKRPGITMFVGKLSYGIASAFIVAAGMMKMPFRIFIAYGSLIAVLQYGTLLIVGFYLGSRVGGSIVSILNNVQYVIGFTALAIAGYYFFSWRMRNRFLAEEKKAEESEIS